MQKTILVLSSKIGLALLTLLLLTGNGAAFSAPPAKTAAQLYPLSRTPERIGAIGCTGIPVQLVIAGRTYSGTYLSHVSELSLAYRSGLRPTDVLISINSRGTQDPKVTQRIVTEIEGRKSTSLSFARKVGGSYRFGQLVSCWSKEAVKTQAPDKAEVRPRVIPNTSQIESILYSLVNAERTKNNLGALSPNSRLAGVALKHAQDMRDRHYISHFTPEGKGFSERAVAAGLEPACGENLEQIALYPTANEIAQKGHEQFMNSTVHRDNLLNPKYKSMGQGLVYDGDGRMILVHMFGY